MRQTLVKSISRAGLLGLVGLTVGCAAVGPDFQRPEAATADTWLQAEDERVDTARAEYEDWWKVFADPALDRLIERAYRQNLGVQIAGLRILEARAQLGFATGLKYPQSQSVGASFVRSEKTSMPRRCALSPDPTTRVGSLKTLDMLINLGKSTSRTRTQQWFETLTE